VKHSYHFTCQGDEAEARRAEATNDCPPLTTTDPQEIDMANREPTLVSLIDEVSAVSVTGDRALITLKSFGAPIRLSLSRADITKLSHWSRMASWELFEQPQSAEIIPFARRA
jgi:hypothetical protein